MTSPDFSESALLLRAARAGDQQSLGRLMQRYRGRLLGRIRLMMGEGARHAADSDDFLQGVFVEILQSFESSSVRDERTFLRWAVAIARNNIVDHVRRRRERAIEGLVSDVVSGRLLAASTTPSRHAIRREEVERVVEAIELLPEDMQRVIDLRQFERLSFREIGRLLDRSENAAQLLHTRALIRLGQALG